MPVSVETTQPFHALEIQLSYDATELRLVGARARRVAGRHPVMAVDTGTQGLIAIALASGDPIDATRAAVLLLEFQTRGGNALAGASVHVVHATATREVSAVAALE
jgi:hypothetical protein